jgi:hypothetical protein
MVPLHGIDHQDGQDSDKVGFVLCKRAEETTTSGKTNVKIMGVGTNPVSI